MKLRTCVSIAIGLLFMIVSATAQNSTTATLADSDLVPRMIKFSGTAADETGKPMSGTLGVTFALYKDEHGGAPLWLETQNVQADANGHYTVMLGATSAEGLPLDLFTSGQARWLGVRAGEQEQARVLLVSVPYAIKAHEAETLGGMPASAFVRVPSTESTGASGGPSTKSNSAKDSALSPALAGSGTTDFVPLWTGGSTLGNSLIYQLGGDIGVGTKTPKASLDVAGAGALGLQSTVPGTQAAIAGIATATTGGATGVYGQSSDPTGNAIFGLNKAATGGVGVIGQSQATSGLVYGVQGAASSTTKGSAGVSGFEAATTGAVFGVSGTTNSTSQGAVGVSGFEGATTGRVFGVSGSTNSTSNFASGIAGSEGAATGQVYGVSGTTASKTNASAGVVGSATSTAGQVFGVYGISNSATQGAAGVSGSQGAATGAVYGVFGSAQSSTTNAMGVGGYEGAQSGQVYAVDGYTTSTGPFAAAVGGFEGATTGQVYGVTGGASSTTNGSAGVNGSESATTGAVFGVSGSANSTTTNAMGVSGYEGAKTGQVYGVNGNTSSAGPFAAGVNGYEGSTTGQVFGVSGSTSSTTNNAAGVSGFEGASTGEVFGVTGSTNSPTSGSSGLNGYEGAASGGPVYGVSGYAAGTGGIGVFGQANSTSGFAVGVEGLSQSSAGVAGQFVNRSGSGLVLVGQSGSSFTTVFSVDAAGNVFVKGKLTKGSGSFKIDHPLDPANKYLSHSFVESPDMMNIYNGNVTTDKHGLAIVVLPDYFGALNRDFRYQLTVIGEFAQAIVKEEIVNNRFTIKTNKPRIKVSWQVTGIRHDAYANAYRIPTEEVKPANEQGHYLHPEVFGVSDAEAIGTVAGIR